MNKFLSTSLIALTVGILPFSASAADILGNKGDPTVADYVAPISWTGFYVGALGGYQFSNSELNYDSDYFDDGEAVAGMGATVDGLGADGLFGEVQIGFDKHLGGRYLVGVLAGVNLNDAEHSIDVSGYAGDESGSANVLSFNQEWGGILGARAGFLTSPNTMVYVAGGWAFGELSDVESQGEKVFDKQENELNGWFGEVGLETRVADGVFFTVAGRYTDYSAITLASEKSEYGDASLELDHDTLAAMAGLKVKLGGLGF